MHKGLTVADMRNKLVKFSQEQQMINNEKLYIEINDGWVSLAYDIMEKIIGVNELLRAEQLSPIILNQIKQKYGSMRVYYVHDPVPSSQDYLQPIIDELDSFIRITTEEADKTCEFCGIVKCFWPHDHNDDEDVKKISLNGWLTTICPVCLRNHHKEINMKMKTNDH